MNAALEFASIFEAMAPLMPLPPIPKINALEGVQPFQSNGVSSAMRHASFI
jgi:hypothetical protein